MTTFVYSLPVVNGSEDTWGATLNTNWTNIGTFIGSLDSAELAKLDGLTASTAELNYSVGVTSAIQTQLDAKADDGTTISAGDGLSGGGSLGANRTISHADTSSQDSVDNSGSIYIQDISVDAYGHVTSISSTTVPSDITKTSGSAPYYGCRAWGKVSSNVLVDGGNFASWDGSTNTVTFTTAMPHANYSVNCNSGAYGATFARNMTTTSFEVVSVSSGGNVGNPTNFEFTVIC